MASSHTNNDTRNTWLKNLHQTEHKLGVLAVDIKDGNELSRPAQEQQHRHLRTMREVKGELRDLAREMEIMGSPGALASEEHDLLRHLNAFVGNVEDLLRPGKGGGAGGVYCGAGSDGDRGSWAGEQQDDNVQLLGLQHHAIESQDSKLDLIAEGISRLHTQSYDMHKELNLQARLLGELDDSMDATGNGMAANNRRVVRVTRQTSSSSWPLCLMALLFLLIVLLLVVDLCGLFNPARCAN